MALFGINEEEKLRKSLNKSTKKGNLLMIGGVLGVLLLIIVFTMVDFGNLFKGQLTVDPNEIDITQSPTGANFMEMQEVTLQVTPSSDAIIAVYIFKNGEKIWNSNPTTVASGDTEALPLTWLGSNKIPLAPGTYQYEVHAFYEHCAEWHCYDDGVTEKVHEGQINITGLSSVPGIDFLYQTVSEGQQALAFKEFGNGELVLPKNETLQFSITTKDSVAVQLSIIDSNGDLVYTSPDEPVMIKSNTSNTEISWNGKDSAGNTFESGKYGYVFDTFRKTGCPDNATEACYYPLGEAIKGTILFDNEPLASEDPDYGTGTTTQSNWSLTTDKESFSPSKGERTTFTATSKSKKLSKLFTTEMTLL